MTGFQLRALTLNANRRFLLLVLTDYQPCKTCSLRLDNLTKQLSFNLHDQSTIQSIITTDVSSWRSLSNIPVCLFGDALVRLMTYGFGFEPIALVSYFYASTYVFLQSVWRRTPKKCRPLRHIGVDGVASDSANDRQVRAQPYFRHVFVGSSPFLISDT
jgi:hypothetical protein